MRNEAEEWVDPGGLLTNPLESNLLGKFCYLDSRCHWHRRTDPFQRMNCVLVCVWRIDALYNIANDERRFDALYFIIMLFRFYSVQIPGAVLSQREVLTKKSVRFMSSHLHGV